MAQTIPISIKLKKAFGNLYRSRCVLILVEDDKGNILLGSKPAFFPPTMTRLLGGGVDEGEAPDVAAARELHEELNVSIDVSQLQEVATFVVTTDDESGAYFESTTYLYYANIGTASYEAGDDVKGIDTVTIDELAQLAKNYAALSDTLWYKGPEGEFCWADYGKMYSVIHASAADYLANR